MNVEEPLPCPFCGNEVKSQSFWWHGCAPGNGPRGYYVFCLECSETDALDGPRRDTFEDAIAAWNRRAPAPEGEACPTCNGVRPEFCSNAFHLASPVVPVGVSVDALAQEIRRVDGRHTLGAGALAEALLPFLAALRPTDTGWREITAEARNGDDVLAYDDETGDCHVSHWTGDYWYGPNGFKPTHWMPLPPAPTDTGANHD